MTETTDYDIVGSYNNQRVTSIDAERSVNMFEYIDPLGKKPKTLINTSGLINTNGTFAGTIATDAFRQQFVFKNVEYSVVGANVYRRTISGLIVLLGTLNTTSGYVGIDANTFQVIFVDGQNGWIYDTTAATFKMITDAAFPAIPIDVCYLDGFFIVPQGGTNNFQLSSFNEGMVWGPAQNNITTNNGALPNQLIIGTSVLSGGLATTANYATGVPVVLTVSGGATLPAGLNTTTTYYSILIDATHIKLATSYANAIAGTAVVFGGDIVVGGGAATVLSLGQLQQGSITTHPGNIVACRTLHRRLFLFSEFYTEVWENQGIGTNLPFRRNNSLLMEYGTPAIGSIAVGFDKMFFLSQDQDGLGSVMEVIGTESIPISNRALDFQLAQYASVQKISDCRAFLIKENGLIFYRMNFTLANHTYVYNVTLSKPNPDVEQALLLWHEEEVLNGDRHPAQTHSYFNGNNFVGSYRSPTLYRVDPNTYTNGGETIRRMRISKAFVPPGYQRIRVDRLQLDLLQGQVDLSDSETIELDLLAEDFSIITTESDIDILLEQGRTIFHPNTLYVFMSISKDGGQTYGYKVRAPMGNVGQRTFRTVWRKLGTTKRGQAFVTKFEFYEEAPFVILGGSWAMEVLPE